jgi:hypothetical protein
MVLRALLMPDENPDLTSAAKRLLPGYGQPPLRVSHVAIGETFAGITEKDKVSCEGFDCAMIELNKLTFGGGLVEVKGIPSTEEFHKTALRLHEIDNRLEPNDCLILALALSDPDCDTFVTSDPTMVKSQRLRDCAGEYGTTIVPLGEKSTGKKRKKSYAGRGIQ